MELLKYVNSFHKYCIQDIAVSSSQLRSNVITVPNHSEDLSSALLTSANYATTLNSSIITATNHIDNSRLIEEVREAINDSIRNIFVGGTLIASDVNESSRTINATITLPGVLERVITTIEVPDE